MQKPKLLVSACLMGVNCKYNGTSNENDEVLKLGETFELIPICPECDGGMSTPRHPSEILNNCVVNSIDEDVTAQFLKGAKIALEIAKTQGINIALFKERSPSCGVNFIYDGSFSKRLIKGKGITAKLLHDNNVTVYSEEELSKLKAQYK